MKAWVYQDAHQVKKHGAQKASWYVGWIDPEGKRRCQSCGPGSRGKSSAEKVRRKREAELIEGTYQSNKKKTWEDFRHEHASKVLAGMDVRNRQETEHAMEQFVRIIRPVRMQAITTRTVAEFVAKRRTERGMKKGSRASPATVNKELRHLRAVLRKAHRWDYLPRMPEFEFLKEPKKLPTYVPPEHFVKIYDACDQAELPDNLPCSAPDWWRALLVTAYMTGWRISALLSLRREDVDLDAARAITRAEDNKGKRDQMIPLHDVVIEHLRKLPGFAPVIFPWNIRRATLFQEFRRIQKEAGIELTGPKGHYGFHDLRRAFATMNADRLTPDALQFHMQHQDYQTTQRYINMARQLNPSLKNLFVPDLSKKRAH